MHNVVEVPSLLQGIDKYYLFCAMLLGVMYALCYTMLLGAIYDVHCC